MRLLLEDIEKPLTSHFGVEAATERERKRSMECHHRARITATTRRSPIVAIVVGVLAPLAMTTLAQGQGGAPFPIEDNLDLPAGARCDFPIHVDASGKGKVLDLPGDRFIFTAPGLKATLTNTLTNHQETFNVTGSFHQRILENGDVEVVATGRNTFGGDPDVGFVLAIGRFSIVFDEAGNVVQPLSGKGQLIDICEALA
jgi:hypothetical protein